MKHTKRMHITRETWPATVPPGVIAAVGAVLGDGNVAHAGALVAGFCAAVAAGFAAIDYTGAFRPGGGR